MKNFNIKKLHSDRLIKRTMLLANLEAEIGKKLTMEERLSYELGFNNCFGWLINEYVESLTEKTTSP